MKSKTNAVPLAWRQEAIQHHIHDFPIATAHDILDHLECELLLNGGFSPTREERIRALQTQLNALIAKIEEQKGVSK